MTDSLNDLSFRALFNAAIDAMLLIGDVGHVIVINPAVQQLFGFTEDEFSGQAVEILMPEIDGLQLQEELSRRKILLPIIFLTGHGDIPMSVRAIKAGAVDFLTKPVKREKLLACVRSALAEAEQRINEVLHNHDALSCLAKLTKREREVMTLAVQGCSNKVIASRLGISYRTVEVHKSKIMHKTGAKNLLDLARIAHEGDLRE